MADDWIKIRTALWTDPRVRAVAESLWEASRSRHGPAVTGARALWCATVTGALVRLWSIADQHADRVEHDGEIDGHLSGWSGPMLDDEVGIEGFAQAISEPDIDWLRIEPKRLILPRFDTHNGASAKQRAQDARRQRRARAARGDNGQAAHESVTVPSRPKRDASVTREEKRREREEKGAPPPGPSARDMATDGAGARDDTRAGGLARLRSAGVHPSTARQLAARADDALIAETIADVDREARANSKIGNRPAVIVWRIRDACGIKQPKGATLTTDERRLADRLRELREQRG